MIEHGNSPLERNKDAAWEAYRRKNAAVFEAGFETYATNLDEEISRAFSDNNRDAVCIDSGLSDGVRIAGGGIFLPLEDAAELAVRMGATGITSHEACGLAKLLATAEGHPNPEEYASHKAKLVADYAGVPYKGHIGIGEMKRTRDFHETSVIYVDETNQFDLSRGEDIFPRGFVVSAGVPTKWREAVTTQVDTAVGIALGHGFGEARYRHDPLRIVHIRKQEQASTYPSELHTIAQKPEYKGLVVVEGFRAVLPQEVSSGVIFQHSVNSNESQRPQGFL